MSSASEPVGTTLTSGAAWSAPRRMIDPLPNCFSMVLTARSTALSRSRLSAIRGSLALLAPFYITGLTFRWSKPDSGERRVLGTRRSHLAFIQNDLTDRRGPKVGLLERREHLVGP